ncbi:hypothetical protein GGI18_000776 [Coemansia linderi]|uniref:Uncharacterized protein n=1 Tax=Coemansia linderi TaxID=2663919 RepID=A0ACC1KN41_9FUNG|nr:hypothetical protein GGI18_000776 [Coemansia linderi]
MSASTITRVLLNNYVPSGSAKISDFQIVQAPAPTKEQLKENEVILRPLYLSVDPYQRNRLSGAKESYIPMYQKGQPISNSLVATKGQPISNSLVATVIASTSGEFQEGDLVIDGGGKWETEYVARAGAIKKAPVYPGINPRDYVGVLGMPSFTAYVGMTVVAEPKAGETILVSSASGAVGQMVVQLAKARGLRVVGVAGSDDKIEYLKSIGADAAFNYKTCGSLEDAIKRAAPEGIDIYFDCVGGELLDAALANINEFARIVVCGAITQYNLSSGEEGYGVKNTLNILIKSAKMQGFTIGGYFGTKIQGEFIEHVSKLYDEGKIKYRMSETVGLENGAQAILDLFEGKNVGKSVIKA